MALKACHTYRRLITSSCEEHREIAFRECVEKVDATVNEEIVELGIAQEFHVGWHRDSYWQLNNYVAHAESLDPYDPEDSITPEQWDFLAECKEEEGPCSYCS